MGEKNLAENLYGIDPLTRNFGASEKGVYYHITPISRLSSISRRGLVPDESRVLHMPNIEEGIEGRVYLGRDIGECEDQLFINEFLGGKLPTSNWVLLKVEVPEDWIEGMDEAGYLYTTRRIPPTYLTNLGRFPIRR